MLTDKRVDSKYFVIIVFLLLTILSLPVQTLNWNSHHIDDYIMEVMALVRDVNETLATIKGNVKRTAEVLAGWVANPMFDRKEGKVRTYIVCVCTCFDCPESPISVFDAAGGIKPQRKCKDWTALAFCVLNLCLLDLSQN